MITKADLTATKRNKGGSLVRIAPAAVAKQNAFRAAARARGDLVKPLPDLSMDQSFRVCDLMDRKTWNKPNQIGLAWPDRGIAFSVTLDEILEVIAD